MKKENRALCPGKAVFGGEANLRRSYIHSWAARWMQEEDWEGLLWFETQPHEVPHQHSYGCVKGRAGTDEQLEVGTSSSHAAWRYRPSQSYPVGTRGKPKHIQHARISESILLSHLKNSNEASVEDNSSMTGLCWTSSYFASFKGFPIMPCPD